MEFDPIIRNGTLLDGTGRPRFHADLGLRDGQMAVVAEVQSRRCAPSSVGQPSGLGCYLLAWERLEEVLKAQDLARPN